VGSGQRTTGSSESKTRTEHKMGVVDYKGLRVYRLAFEAAMQVFEFSKVFPADEKYSLRDQMRRSSRSACANIAEAWRKRRYQPAFVSKLSDADAEAAETEVWLEFALRCGYIAPDCYAKLRDHYDHICRQLRVMMDGAEQWCSSSHEAREQLADYFVDAAEL